MFPEAFEQPKPVYPLCKGDVYKHPTGLFNSFLLVDAVYEGDKRWALLGMGCSANSNEFHHILHDAADIQTYLEQKGMVFEKNINHEISKLVG